ncbi:hypothetical protein ACSSS7_007290 [Eimeria intestinalis]
MEHVEVRCAIYLDDAFIDSPDLRTHIKGAPVVLRTLKTHKPYPKITKYRLAQQRLYYLGCSIGADGIQISEEGISVIQEWPERLGSVTEVLQFLGLVWFVGVLMGGTSFADAARPLVELTKKNVSFVCGPAQAAAIRKLKARRFWLRTRRLLQQEGRPLAFLSKKMNYAKIKYSAYKQELLALITALHKRQHLLRPVVVTAYTDNRSLQHLLTLSARLRDGWTSLPSSPASPLPTSLEVTTRVRMPCRATPHTAFHRLLKRWGTPHYPHAPTKQWAHQQDGGPRSTSSYEDLDLQDSTP